MQWTCAAHERGLVGADGGENVCFMKETSGSCQNRRQCRSRTRKHRHQMETRLEEPADLGNPIFAEVASELPVPADVLVVEPEDEPVPSD